MSTRVVGVTRRAFAITLTLTAAVLFAGCGRRASKDDRSSGPGPAVAAKRDEPARRHRKGGTDVTFAVVSDTHFGFGGMVEANRKLALTVNGIEGRAYPPAIGGKVARPRGLFITGDLTEWGKPDEWAPFVANYGLSGNPTKEGAVLGIPVFEMIGNHDKVHGPWVEAQVKARHGGGRFYSVDFDDLHLVALGEAPDDEGLAFLTKDLEQLAPDVPIALFFHLALLGKWSDDLWLADGDHKARLHRIVEKRNVAAIFHGHHHFTEHYTWHGIDVFKPGAVKDDAHTFAVVRVTDDRFTLGSFDWEHDRWADTFTKDMPRMRAR